MSSFVSASTGAFTDAAQRLTGIGSSIASANTAAAVSTAQVAATSQDEVSGAIAAVFSGHGQAYQAISARLAAFHDRFAQILAGSGSSYASAEAANAQI
jgi:PE family protein